MLGMTPYDLELESCFEQGKRFGTQYLKEEQLFLDKKTERQKERNHTRGSASWERIRYHL